MPNRVLIGHALDALKMLESESVHQVVTSPPYWGLRDYKAPAVVWGDNDCEHEWGDLLPPKPGAGNAPDKPSGFQQKAAVGQAGALAQMNKAESNSGQFCSRCDCWKGQLGLEPTPELYVEHLVAVFREVWRVLRSDGTVFLNLGDSYASGKGTCFNPGGGSSSLGQRRKVYGVHPCDRGSVATLARAGLKPKDLCGIPWRVAFALQADGWYWRSTIIWNKPNPMPESCDDRPTTAHEYIFLFAKSGTAQYWTHRDFNGVRRKPKPDYRYVHADGHEVKEEPANWRTSIITCPVCNGAVEVREERPIDGLFDGFTALAIYPCPRCGSQPIEEPQYDEGHERQRQPPRGKVWEWRKVNLWRGHDYFYDADAVREKYQPASIERCRYETNKFGAQPNDEMARLGKGKRGGNPGTMVELNPAGRNLRSVWTITTRGCPEAHFATFPLKLPATCIKTSPTKVCKKCGAGWERVTEREPDYTGYPGGPGGKKYVGLEGYSKSAKDPKGPPRYKVDTVGFRPTCTCYPEGEEETARAVILDMFGGKGTTALAALSLGRRFVHVDIGYPELTQKTLGIFCPEIEYAK